MTPNQQVSLRILTASLLLAASTLHSQVSSTQSNVQTQLQHLASAYASAQVNPIAGAPSAVSKIEAQIGPLTALGFIAAHYPIPDNKPLFLKAVATQQIKTQVGAVPNASGSTSLVQKPLAAQLLNIAVENGAVLDDINGTNLTLSSSPYAVIAAFAGDSAETYTNYSGYARLGFNGSFRIADTSDPLASVNQQQLSNAGATFRFTKDHSSRSTEAKAVFDAKYGQLQQNAVNSVAGLETYLVNEDGATATLVGPTTKADYALAKAAYNAAVSKFKTDIATAILADQPSEAGKSVADVTTAVAAILSKYFDADLAPALNQDARRPDAEVSSYLAAYSAYIAALPGFTSAVSALTAESAGSILYNYQQPADATAYQEAGFSYSGTPKGWGGDVTANALGSFYSKSNAAANQGTFRGASAAVELNLKFARKPVSGSTGDQSPVTLAFSGKYQRVQENQHVAGKKADIGEGNVKLTIPLPGGLSFPLSATFANAGQSINESYIRGNFGITFDLDKLSALLKN